jgi:hypothetical protein
MTNTVTLMRRDGVRQIGVVVSAVGLYELARLAMEPNWAVAAQNARRIVRLEHALLLGWERPLQDFFLNTVPDVVQAMNVFYFVGHFLLTGVFFLGLYDRSRHGFRVFRDGFLAATAIAVLVHWLFPTAPPRLVLSDVVDTLWFFNGIDIGSPGNDALSNPVAAVPSLHAGYAVGVGVGILLYTRSMWARGLGVVYPLAVVLTIIVTGNHFVLDAIAGVLVMGIGFAVVEQGRRWRREGRFGRDAATLPVRRGVEQSGSSPGS